MNAEPTPADAILLLGPTASGKTAATLELAARCDIEVISVDSALVFRDMNIGTAKPSAAEQALCPHHLIDVVSPESSYSAALFRDEALRLIGDIRQRGRLPVLAGGTMLYFKALIDGLSDLPQADASLRARIDADAKRLGWPALHAELATLDPDAAARLAPMDAQRIQRALEIVRITGRPLAESYARREPAPPAYRYHTLALMPAERSSLHTRIAERFELMLDQGLENEVRGLREKYTLQPDMTSMRCVGYRQMWDYIEGHDSWSVMRDKGIAATRQLAKRQITWMRQFRQHWPRWHEIDSLQTGALDLALEALAIKPR